MPSIPNRHSSRPTNDCLMARLSDLRPPPQPLTGRVLVRFLMSGQRARRPLHGVRVFVPAIENRRVG